MSNSSPLIFVFQGAEWPSYVNYSLRLATQTARVPILVLSNLDPIVGIESVEWFAISDFYGRDDFSGFKSRSALPGSFRDGFWFHTVERFFILRDFVKSKGLRRFFHGELDCVFMQLNELEEEIERSSKEGFFFPRETLNRGLGSLIYVNERTSLSDLCDHFIEHANLGTPDATFGNEMHLLGLLRHESNGGWCHALPSAEFLFAAEPRPWPLFSDTCHSVVDGAVIGRWLFGMDPANTGRRGTSNLIQNHQFLVPFDHELSALEFNFTKKTWQLLARNRVGGDWAQIRVVHVHSKAHQKLSARYVARIISRVNRGRKTRIVPPEPQYFFDIFRRYARHIYFLARNRELRAMLLAKLSRTAISILQWPK